VLYQAAKGGGFQFEALLVIHGDALSGRDGAMIEAGRQLGNGLPA